MGRAVGFGVVHEFTPDQARALGGPFADERVAAAERAAAMPWPTAAEEIWRYSRIGELDLDRFAPGELDDHGRRRRRRGFVVDRRGRPRALPTSSTATRRTSSPSSTPPSAARSSSRSRPARSSPSRSSSTTRSSAPAPPCSRGSSSTPATTARSPSSSASRRPTATTCSSCRSSRCAPARPPGSATSPSTSCRTRRGRSATSRPSASATRSSRWPPSPSAATTPGCAPRPGIVGARRQHQPGRPVLRRRRADARLPHDPGPRRPAHDQRPAVQGRRAGPRRAASTPGLIKIRKHARGTVAFQTNRNLTLSEGAWAESVPNLEIETNDVQVQPRLDGRPDRRGAALLPREPRHPARRSPSG